MDELRTTPLRGAVGGAVRGAVRGGGGGQNYADTWGALPEPPELGLEWQLKGCFSQGMT